MGDAGSEEWALFQRWQINSSGYGAQQLAACLLAKWGVFLAAHECAHHVACGTGFPPLPRGVRTSPSPGSQPVLASIRTAEPEK